MGISSEFWGTNSNPGGRSQDSRPEVVLAKNPISSFFNLVTPQPKPSPYAVGDLIPYRAGFLKYVNIKKNEKNIWVLHLKDKNNKEYSVQIQKQDMPTQSAIRDQLKNTNLEIPSSALFKKPSAPQQPTQQATSQSSSAPKPGDTREADVDPDGAGPQKGTYVSVPSKDGRSFQTRLVKLQAFNGTKWVDQGYGVRDIIQVHNQKQRQLTKTSLDLVGVTDRSQAEDRARAWLSNSPQVTGKPRTVVAPQPVETFKTARLDITTGNVALSGPTQARGFIELLDPQVAPDAQRYLQAGNALIGLSGSDLQNFVGVAMDLAPNVARVPGRGNQLLYQGEVLTPIGTVSAALRAAGGEAPRVRPVPVYLRVGDNQLAKTVIFRVQGRDGRERIVDNVGRTYDSLKNWKQHNQLGAVEVFLPQGGQMTGRDGKVLLEAFNNRRFDNTALPVVRGGVAILGAAAGVAVMLGTGGVAAPLVMAGGAVFSVADSGVTLADRFQHGQTLNLTNQQARAAWLDFGAGLLGAGAIGSGLKGVARASDLADVLTLGNSATDLAIDWNKLSPGERALAGAQLAFWSAMLGASQFSGGRFNLDPLTKPGGGRGGDPNVKPTNSRTDPPPTKKQVEKPVTQQLSPQGIQQLSTKVFSSPDFQTRLVEALKGKEQLASNQAGLRNLAQKVALDTVVKRTFDGSGVPSNVQLNFRLLAEQWAKQQVKKDGGTTAGWLEALVTHNNSSAHRADMLRSSVAQHLGGGNKRLQNAVGAQLGELSEAQLKNLVAPGSGGAPQKAAVTILRDALVNRWAEDFKLSQKQKDQLGANLDQQLQNKKPNTQLEYLRKLDTNAKVRKSLVGDVQNPQGAENTAVTNPPTQNPPKTPKTVGSPNQGTPSNGNSNSIGGKPPGPVEGGPVKNNNVPSGQVSVKNPPGVEGVPPGQDILTNVSLIGSTELSNTAKLKSQFNNAERKKGETPGDFFVTFITNNSFGRVPTDVHDIHSHESVKIFGDTEKEGGHGSYDLLYAGNRPPGLTDEQWQDLMINRLIEQSTTGKTIIFPVAPVFPKRITGSNGKLADGTPVPDYYAAKDASNKTIHGTIEIRDGRAISSEAIFDRNGNRAIVPFNIPVKELEALIGRKVPPDTKSLTYVTSLAGCELHFSGPEIDEAVLKSHTTLIKREQEIHGTNVIAEKYIVGLTAGNPRADDSARNVYNSIGEINIAEAKAGLPPGTVGAIQGETNLSKELVHAMGGQTPLVYNSPAELKNLNNWADAMGKAGMPVIIHLDSGTPTQANLNKFSGGLAAFRAPSNLANIDSFVKFANDNPNTTIIWAHAGLGYTIEMPPGYLNTLQDVLDRTKNVTIDISWDAIHRYIAEDPKEWARFIANNEKSLYFGSDTIATTQNTRPNSRLDVAKSLEDTGLLRELDKIDPTLKERLFSGNFEETIVPAVERVKKWRTNPDVAKWLKTKDFENGVPPPFIWRPNDSGDYQLIKNPEVTEKSNTNNQSTINLSNQTVTPVQLQPPPATVNNTQPVAPTVPPTTVAPLPKILEFGRPVGGFLGVVTPLGSAFGIVPFKITPASVSSNSVNVKKDGALANVSGYFGTPPVARLPDILLPSGGVAKGTVNIVGLIKKGHDEGGVNFAYKIPTPAGDVAVFFNVRQDQFTVKQLQALKEGRIPRDLASVSGNFGIMYSISDAFIKSTTLANPALGAQLEAVKKATGGSNVYAGVGWRGSINFEKNTTKGEMEFTSVSINGIKIPVKELGTRLNGLQENTLTAFANGYNGLVETGKTVQQIGNIPVNGSVWDIVPNKIQLANTNAPRILSTPNGGAEQLIDKIYKLGTRYKVLGDNEKIKNAAEAAKIIDKIAINAKLVSSEEYQNAMQQLINPYGLFTDLRTGIVSTELRAYARSLPDQLSGVNPVLPDDFNQVRRRILEK
jgi:hypothetical protein